MIKCSIVNELGCYNKIGILLKKEITRLNSSGCKILNIFETKTTKVPRYSDQEFVIIYDDAGESIRDDTDKYIRDDAGESIRDCICGRCKYDGIPETNYPCNTCIYGKNNRMELWEAKDDE